MYDRNKDREPLHSLALMNEIEQAQTSGLTVDVRAHLQEAINHMELIHEHLEESIDLLETSGARRDAEKAKEHMEIALNLALTAMDGPEAKLAAALQECREHIETANRQLSRAGMDVVV